MTEVGDFVYLKRTDCCGTDRSYSGVIRVEAIDGDRRWCDYYMEPNEDGLRWFHYERCFSKFNTREL